MAGLNATETGAIVELVQRINADGVSILLIEHIMRAVMRLSDRIVVLSFGEKIAEGLARRGGARPRVVEAYLGEAYVDPARLEAIEAALRRRIRAWPTSRWRCGEGRRSPCSARTAPARPPRCARSPGSLPLRRGRIELDGRRVDGLTSAAIVALGDRPRPRGPPAVPDDDGRGEPRARRRTAACAGAEGGDPDASSRCSRGSRSGAASSPARSRAVSSRCARSAAG